VLALYRANAWSSAEKPDALILALAASHSVITAWDGDTLAGLGNALSDGHLVVYYPHLLVLPSHHKMGIGAEIMRRMRERYAGLHQHMLIADPDTIPFYKKCGFEPAGRTQSMWIYAGGDH